MWPESGALGPGCRSVAGVAVPQGQRPEHGPQKLSSLSGLLPVLFPEVGDSVWGRPIAGWGSLLVWVGEKIQSSEPLNPKTRLESPSPGALLGPKWLREELGDLPSSPPAL